MGWLCLSPSWVRSKINLPKEENPTWNILGVPNAAANRMLPCSMDPTITYLDYPLEGSGGGQIKNSD